MKKYTAEELAAVVASHGKWLRGEVGGSRAYLQGAKLQGAYLLCMGDMRYIKTMQVDTWMIGYTNDTLQIGCQRHLISEWWAFDDEEVGAMDSLAIEWWRSWKPILQAMIAASPAMPTGQA